MNKINYSQIYTKVTKGLSPKVKDIFDRRFGIGKAAPETLESIGKSLRVTRERVRQIEEGGFSFIKKNHKDTLEKVFVEFRAYFESTGGLKREDLVLNDLGGTKYQHHVLFLLRLSDEFERVCEKKEYHYFWSTMQDAEKKVADVLRQMVADISQYGKPMPKQQLFAQLLVKYHLTEAALQSYLEISKKIQPNSEGSYGLIHWPEIKPRSVKDKALLVFRRHQKPLHFKEITSLIDQLELAAQKRKTHPQTVHNELIKDPRFVLVGRGMYALSEWGYIPGTVKDIILSVLKEKPQLTSKEDIVKEVLAQRLVKRNTVLIKLNNKKYFLRDQQGKYFPTTSQTA